MVGCSVFGCKSNTVRKDGKEADVTFHAFPTDDEIRKKWMAGTGKKNWVPHKNSRICSKHFEQHCFRKTQKLTFIEKFSIPTLFIHKFPVSQEIRVESLPTEFMDCQSQPDTNSQQHSEPAKSIACPSSNKSMPCTEDLTVSPRKLKLTLQLNRQTLLAESRRKKIEPHVNILSHRHRLQKKISVSQEVRVESLPTESMDCQSQPDTHAQQHSEPAKSVNVECPNSSIKSMPSAADPTMPLRNLKLTLQLNRQTLLAESRRKKIEALRSKNRRLQTKNAELLAIIEDLKTKIMIKQEPVDPLAIYQNNSDSE